VQITPELADAIRLAVLAAGLFVAAAGLFFNAYATLRTVSSRRILNYLELTKSHRDLWKLTLDDPETYKRILQVNPDLATAPITYAERRFVNLLLLHTTTAFEFSKVSDIVRIEQLKQDVDEVLALPLPRAIWIESKYLFNKDFVSFVEKAPRQSKAARPRPSLAFAKQLTILVLSGHKKQLVDPLSRFGDKLIFLGDNDPTPTSRFIRDNEVDVVVCFGYGRILSSALIELVPIINVHPSLLPLDRGPNPHLWSVINGSPRGATIHYIDRGIDTGDIIAQRQFSRPDQSTSFQLSFDQLIADCATLFAETWPSIRAGSNSRTPQQGPGTKHSFRDQEAIAAMWKEGDVSLSIRDFREKAIRLLSGPRVPASTAASASLEVPEGSPVHERA